MREKYWWLVVDKLNEQGDFPGRDLLYLCPFSCCRLGVCVGGGTVMSGFGFMCESISNNLFEYY
jgi:hypothetical protein